MCWMGLQVSDSSIFGACRSGLLISRSDLGHRQGEEGLPRQAIENPRQLAVLGVG
jgi:hypothetical protein